jgi:hypothetical protein
MLRVRVGVKIELEFFLQSETPAPQSLDLFLIDIHGNWTIGYNSEDYGFFYTDVTHPRQFRDVVYWALIPEIPHQDVPGIITSDEVVDIWLKQGKLKRHERSRLS